ncbi:MAG: hypothetical protein QM677_06620 [Microbacterium sp.]
MIASVSFGVTAVVVLSTSAQAASSTETPSATATAQPASLDPVEELVIGDVTDVGSAEDISGPIDSYRPSAKDENRVLLAEYKAMQSCMKRYGLTFDQPVWTVPSENHDYDRLFGVLDLSEAQSYGYHVPGDAVLASGETEKGADSKSDSAELDPAFLDVAMGDGETQVVNGQKIPDGGCIAEARAKIGDDYAIQSLYEEAVNYGLSQSDRDPRVIAAFGSWSRCMAAFGFDYATPREAINDPQWATQVVAAAEIETATADIKCKVSTGLTSLRVAVAYAWQAEFITTHAKELDAAIRSFATQLTIADSLL